jgi:hypothetical protein
MIASGLSTCPMDVKDLTFQPFVGNMGTNRSGSFLLSGGIGEGLAAIYEISRDWRWVASLWPHLKIRPVVSRPERVVVASGGRSVC